MLVVSKGLQGAKSYRRGTKNKKPKPSHQTKKATTSLQLSGLRQAEECSGIDSTHLPALGKEINSKQTPGYQRREAAAKDPEQEHPWLCCFNPTPGQQLLDITFRNSVSLCCTSFPALSMAGRFLGEPPEDKEKETNDTMAMSLAIQTMQSYL